MIKNIIVEKKFFLPKKGEAKGAATPKYNKRNSQKIDYKRERGPRFYFFNM